MTEKLGRVVRSQWEDIWVLLERGQEEPHLELRLHNRGPSSEREGASAPERIGLPVRLLPDLLQTLMQAQEQLRAWGLLKRSQPGVNVGGPTRRMDARQFPRVVMNPATECRVVDPEGPELFPSVIGQIRDLSQGGAQAGFPSGFRSSSKSMSS